MRIHLLTLFPEALAPFLEHSILGRARSKGLLEIDLVNPRNFSKDPHRKVDDRPYGGGAGMLLTPEPVFLAMESVRAQDPATHGILLDPRGERLTQTKARALALLPSLTLVSGHYEGVDDRIRTGLGLEALSIGDYVLSGGEAAALVVADAVIRLLPGALGDPNSAVEESFAEEGLLEYPQFTRPPVFRGMEVPEVLRNGDHAAIRAWRKQQSGQQDRKPT